MFFWKFYVMSSPEIDLYGIFHVKVDFIVALKMYVLVILGRFVWTTWFEQCVVDTVLFTQKNRITSKITEPTQKSDLWNQIQEPSWAMK